MDNSFSVLAQRIKDNKDKEESAIALNKEKYTNYATEIAKDITANPGRAVSSYLQNRCDEIGADYIILFDENGDEYVSNAGFVGLRIHLLGKMPLLWDLKKKCLAAMWSQFLSFRSVMNLISMRLNAP